MKTKREILEETANYYNSLNRAYDGGCTYITNDGRMCAVGRCLINPQIFMDEKVYGICDVNKEYLEQHLKPEYKGHSIVFWSSLQNFHDVTHYWNENGMTEKGRGVYTELLKHFEI